MPDRATKEAGFRKRHPTLSKIYDMLPGYPDIPADEAPIDQILPYLGAANPATAALNIPGIVNAAGEMGVDSLITKITQGLGFGGQAFGLGGFDPNTAFYKGVERQGDSNWIIDEATGYPIEVAGAPQTMAARDMLPEVGETIVPKGAESAPPPMPTRKPKAPAPKKAAQKKADPWNTIVTGLGEYGR